VFWLHFVVGAWQCMLARLAGEEGEHAGPVASGEMFGVLGEC
jgi:hypothetical protein